MTTNIITGHIKHWFIQNNIKLPFGLTPMWRDSDGYLHSEFSEEIWNEYEWNPPPGEVEEDPDASPKPTWDELISAYEETKIKECKFQTNLILNTQATIRIGILYHKDAKRQPEKEWQVRFSGKDLSKEDAERIRLIKRHNEIKQRVEATTNIHTLESIQDVLDMDELWSAIDFPNTFPK